ncbi:hypothetical protein HIMB5_00008150 [alpha proteobacterium HIMB5]|nr:hypothetical protein HIMB5_00008150 [alpha proteobacterium HIMB5]
MNDIKYEGWELEHFDNSYNFRNYQNSLIKNDVNGYIAEVGPGNGENLNLYIKKAKQIDLYEPSKNLYQNLKIKYSHNKYISIKNQLFFADENIYDTIIYLDVLEHIEKDDLEIAKAFKSLKSGGKLIVNVPAFQHLYSEFDKEVNHFRRYDKNSILKLIKKLNYSNFKMTYYDSVGYLLSLLSKIFSKNYKKNFNRKIKIWNSLIPLSRLLDKIFFNLFGKSLLVIIIKK